MANMHGMAPEDVLRQGQETADARPSQAEIDAAIEGDIDAAILERIEAGEDR